MLGAAACQLGGSDNRTPTIPRAPGDSAQQVVFGFRSNIITHEGELIAALRADSARAYDDATRYDLYNVSVVFLDTANAVISTLTSEKGTYLVHDGRFEAHGTVVVQREDGRQVHTSFATIDRPRRLVVSDSAYRYVDGNTQREGTGFELDPATLVPRQRTLPVDSAPRDTTRR